MKIAISNIAWQIEEEEAISQILKDFGIKGVEIAPTKVWKNPLSATSDEIRSYKQFWNDRGIDIVAMQALLFGRPDLTIFESAEVRKKSFDYLSGMIRLGVQLGVNTLVFGSPKNRRIGDMKLEEAMEIAQSFFYELGEVAHQNGVIFCLEPNPAIYNCDFITDSQQGLDLVNRTNSQGFRLHLDAAGMTLSEEPIELSLSQSFSYLCHFHISEPYLGIVGDNVVDHKIFGQTLEQLNYSGWMSIEMKAQNAENNTPYVRQALETAIEYYAS